MKKQFRDPNIDARISRPGAIFLYFASFTAVPKNGPKMVRSSKNAEKLPNQYSYLEEILYKDKCSGNSV